MSVASLMAHRATLQHQTTEVDGFGQPLDSWTTYASMVSCRWYPPRGVEMTGNETKDVQTETHIVFMPPSTAITEGDRIGAITQKDGTVLARELDVQHVYRVSTQVGTGHHLEVRCQRIRGTSNAV